MHEICLPRHGARSGKEPCVGWTGVGVVYIQRSGVEVVIDFPLHGTSEMVRTNKSMTLAVASNDR